MPFFRENDEGPFLKKSSLKLPQKTLYNYPILIIDIFPKIWGPGTMSPAGVLGVNPLSFSPTDNHAPWRNSVPEGDSKWLVPF